MDEKKQIARLISGDKAVINELYGKFSVKLYHFAFGYLKSEQDALDIIKEVFVKLWENRKMLNKDSKLNANLFTVAKNTIISVFRKQLTDKQNLENLKNQVV
ncbi:MAG: RNA polymerase sigma factor, partial [Draconibacterium sp.]